jgi:hypothetical protein
VITTDAICVTVLSMLISFPQDVRARQTLRTIRIVKPKNQSANLVHATIPRLNEILGIIVTNPNSG